MTTLLSMPTKAAIEQPTKDIETGAAKGSDLDPMFALQGMIVEEFASVGREWLDRAETEAHLFNEFLSKMAEADSVRDLKTMWEECGQHQVDFIRRDCERILRHSERMIKATSRLFPSAPRVMVD